MSDSADARRQLYVDALTDLGYRPRLDEDGDVLFHSEGVMCYVDIDQEDDEYFRIVVPTFWSLDSAEERERAVVTADHANPTIKVAKVYTIGDGVSASVELLFSEPTHALLIVTRALRTLHYTVRFFTERMLEP